MADGVTKTPNGKINDLLIKINGIIIPIKVLVIEATQYQALVGKQTNKLTWEINDLTWTDNEQEEALSWEWNKDKRKEKRKEEGTPPTAAIYNSYTYHTSQQSNYQWPRLVCIDCGKKLSCCGNDEEYHTATKFYCCPCLLECFG
ncbi:hypothetical protein G9A89_019934 [Geosiphon pyriformis]|nr:hypothetical protein G9A89_019934 [Geosiphon pyriformis]